MAKKYKAIFGNPPYSIPNGNTSPPLLWDKFSDSSIAMAEEVYYITPYIWNGRVKKFIRDHNTRIRKIDLTAVNSFTIGGSICYWNTHGADRTTIHTENSTVEIDRLSDLYYIPFDIENTLTIHKKGWAKNRIMGFKHNGRIDAHYHIELLRDEQDDEFKYPVYSTSIYNMKYTNEKGIRLYGLDLFHRPKIIIGRTRDNNPFIDRNGEYANTNFPYYLTDTIDNLEIRYKQLQSKFTKCWLTTGTQDVNGNRNAFIYHATLRLFPDIPLSITEDQEIYEYFGLNDDEVRIVEYYAEIVDGVTKRRHDKHTGDTQAKNSNSV